MPLHYWMPVETVDGAVVGCKEIAKSLVPANGGCSNDKRLPIRRAGSFAEDRDADVNRAADRTDGRRRVKRRTHLVVAHGRLKLRERLEGRGQMNIHPVRRLCAGDAGDADRAVAGESAELLGRGDFDEHHCRKAGEGHHLHDGGRAREVVAAEGEQRPGRKAD